MGAIGNIIGGFSQYQSAQYSKGVALSNQSLATNAASDATARGGLAASKQLMKGAQVEGAQRVGFAGGGVDVQSGSALSTQADTKMMSELDAATLRNNAAREAWGYKMQSHNFGEQATMEENKGDNALAGSILGGIGSLATLA